MRAPAFRGHWRRAPKSLRFRGLTSDERARIRRPRLGLIFAPGAKGARAFTAGGPHFVAWTRRTAMHEGSSCKRGGRVLQVWWAGHPDDAGRSSSPGRREGMAATGPPPGFEVRASRARRAPGMACRAPTPGLLVAPSRLRACVLQRTKFARAPRERPASRVGGAPGEARTDRLPGPDRRPATRGRSRGIASKIAGQAVVVTRRH